MPVALADDRSHTPRAEGPLHGCAHACVHGAARPLTSLQPGGEAFCDGPLTGRTGHFLLAHGPREKPTRPGPTGRPRCRHLSCEPRPPSGRDRHPPSWGGGGGGGWAAAGQGALGRGSGPAGESQGVPPAAAARSWFPGGPGGGGGDSFLLHLGAEFAYPQVPGFNPGQRVMTLSSEDGRRAPVRAPGPRPAE